MSDSPEDRKDEALPWADDASESETPAPTAAELEEAGQSALFGGSDGEAQAEPDSEAQSSAPAEKAEKAQEPAPSSGQPYRVLARRYRPTTFSELIGQDAMVQTLANAIKRERLAHAFLMTGVRGVGKTSTARLIAKSLNCIGPDGEGGPTFDPCGVCEPCVAIAEGRHIDVIEMDAASHTGVDDVREIIEAVRYAAVSARYKIYIIDEVHMLSRNAFNALLKTLEEPPEHVKFLFATTEVEKLPVTVLSRCQRFDLKRIPAPLLAEHFANVCAQEQVEAEEEALAMIAAAAEGSVRDGLSILDQAISHAGLEGSGKVTADQVRDMLGLADKGAQRMLFSAMLAGDGPALLKAVEHQFALGIEPVSLVRGALDLTPRVTVAQISGEVAQAASAEERDALQEWSQRLTPGSLHRLWQLLLKGFEEVRSAPDPLIAAQMALLRVMHANDLPDPGALVKQLSAATPPQAIGAAQGAPAASGPAPSARSWAQLVEQVARIDAHLANKMKLQVRIVSLGEQSLVYARAEGFSEDIAADMRDALLKTTGERWQVERVESGGAPSLFEEDQARLAAGEAAVRADPMVVAALEAFPEAELLGEEESARIVASGTTRK